MGEPTRTDQIISQLQSKILTAILSSRIPSLLPQPGSEPDPDPASATLSRRRARWFNLALPDLENLNTSHPPFDPLLIDVLLSNLDGGHVVERWTATCNPPPPPSVGDSSALHRRSYKKSIVLLRSLYSVLRLLPCFKIFKKFSSSIHSYNYELRHRISSFAEPFSRSEEKNLKIYSFTPVESQFGYITLSVTYRHDLSLFDISPSSLTPPMIIPDYVGSPAADPTRPFRPAPPSRPHSWDSKCIPIRKPAPEVGSSVVTRRASFGFEEFRLSPPFSVSPTPSPPAMYAGGSSLRARMRSETAPVSIPEGMRVAGKGYRMVNHSDPARSFLPPPSPRSTRMEHSSNQDSLSSESRSFRKSEGLKLADFYSNLHLYSAQKGLKDGRDDSGRFSGGFSSSGSPRFGFSRSSSRLSIQDDLDDCDFSFPFAVDDVDTSDSQTRNLDGREAPESSQATSSHKSQDAEVGVLVHMLRTAPPLRQDHSYSSQSSRSEINGELGNSSFYLSRKTSDAMEELRSYREIKDILLSQSNSVTGFSKATK